MAITLNYIDNEKLVPAILAVNFILTVCEITI